MLYTVGEMAKLMNVSASTLRYYDQEGLLPFVERSNSGIRMFSQKDFEWLKIIECLKKSGLSIKEIKAYIEMASKGDASLKDRLSLFEARREEVKKQIRDLEETLDLLEYKCWYYQKAIEDGTEEHVRNMALEELPEPQKQAKKKMITLQQADQNGSPNH